MTAFLTAANATYLGLIVVFLIAIVFMFLRRSRRLSSAEMTRDEKRMDADEHELKKLHRQKKDAVHDVRVMLGERKFKEIRARLGDIGDIISRQKKVLKDLTHIDREDLAHLKHVKVSVGGKSQKLHVSQFIKDLEHVTGSVDSSHEREEKLKEIRDDPDAVRRCVKFIAFTFVYLHIQFGKLHDNFMSQTRALRKIKDYIDKLEHGEGRAFRPDRMVQKTANILARIEREVVDEAHELDIILEHSDRLMVYTRQLEQVEAEKRVQKGPFLSVAGHNVGVVVDLDSRDARSFGRGERIPLGSLPEEVRAGGDAHKCLIVMGHDSDDVHAIFERHGSGIFLKPAQGNRGTFVIRPGKGLLILCDGVNDKKRVKALLDKMSEDYDDRYDAVKKHLKPGQKKEKDVYITGPLKLKHDDRIILAFGYEFDVIQG